MLTDYATTPFRGAIAARRGDLQRANKWLRTSLQIKRELGAEPGIPESLAWIGSVCELAGRLDDAKESYEECRREQWRWDNYFGCTALVGLARVLNRKRQYRNVSRCLAEAEALAVENEYNDQLAVIRLLQAQMALAGISGQCHRETAEAVTLLQEALTYALRFNRFLLEEILIGEKVRSPFTPILSFCLSRRDEGYEILAALAKWWQTGTNTTRVRWVESISQLPENIPIVEAELLAEKLEPGDGSSAKRVVDMLAIALPMRMRSSR